MGSCQRVQSILTKPWLRLTQLEPLVYTKPEDEFFHKHCSWSFTIATPTVWLPLRL